MLTNENNADDDDSKNNDDDDDDETSNDFSICRVWGSRPQLHQRDPRHQSVAPIITPTIPIIMIIRMEKVVDHDDDDGEIVHINDQSIVC